MQRALEITERFGQANSKMISLHGYLLAKLGRTPRRVWCFIRWKRSEGSGTSRDIQWRSCTQGLNERDAALQSLERALQARDVNLVFLAGRSEVGPVSKRSAVS